VFVTDYCEHRFVDDFICSDCGVRRNEIIKVPEHHLDLIQKLKDSQQTLLAEIERLKAQIYVLKDSQLRTYDGMTERIERYREAVTEVTKEEEGVT
jgi:septation ring formation regulator EzrA